MPHLLHFLCHLLLDSYLPFLQLVIAPAVGALLEVTSDRLACNSSSFFNLVASEEAKSTAQRQCTHGGRRARVHQKTGALSNNNYYGT